ncbi:hypothetical protein Godav_022083 [Gossypium davidsonii]|uniref:Uncharacterized protein n=2 Tax=Gossypium TaxID=3633 RepID=A0A7J8T760_GOSDV|nr:hypothetical protein [Gossypium davidsonii]MBA0673097.1 hypothetical protein [Gossypium klotzschianum]
MKKRVDVFALSIYRLVIFPKVLGHVDEAVQTYLIGLKKGSHPSQRFWPKLLDL